MKQEFLHVIVTTVFITVIYFSSLVSHQMDTNYTLFNKKDIKMTTKPKKLKSNHGKTTEPNNTTDFKLEHCPCRRTIPRNTKTKITEFSKTTCGFDAYQRGSQQKVVSYSFYGNPTSKEHKKRKYFAGIEENLKAIQSLYGKDWTMRLYVDLEKKDPLFSKLCKLACQNPSIDLCLAGSLPGTPIENAINLFPMLWRFFPTLDPQVKAVY